MRTRNHVIITLHGEPIMKIRAITAPEQRLGSRMEQLAKRGILVRSASKLSAPRPIVRRLGALKRFLNDRNR